jgi:hypothetical protein
MEAEMKKLYEEVNNLKGTDIIIENEKIFALASHASEMKDEHPEEAYRALAMAAFKAVSLPDSFNQSKEDLLMDCSNLIDQFKGRDWYFDSVLAEMLRRRNEGMGAGRHYERAAKALLRTTGVRVLTEQVHSGDASLRPEAYLRDAIANYYAVGAQDAVSRCYLKSMTLQRDRARGWKKIKMWFSYLFWAWGESPWRVVGWATLVIVSFACLYCTFGIRENGILQKYDLGNSLYLSIITFTTIGYGDYQPAGPLGKTLASIEGLLGIFFTGLFLVTFVKKFSR